MTKSQAKPTNLTACPPLPDPAAGREVLTLAEAAVYLRFSGEEIVPLVREQGLPGRQLDQEWRFLRAAVQDWLRTPPPAPNPRQDLMRWAGAFQDHPDLKEIVREAHRQRGRPITEECE
jgi:excisionase family DNA binding protein